MHLSSPRIRIRTDPCCLLRACAFRNNVSCSSSSKVWENYTSFFVLFVFFCVTATTTTMVGRLVGRLVGAWVVVVWVMCWGYFSICCMQETDLEPNYPIDLLSFGGFNMLNLSLNAFKIRCKETFLSWMTSSDPNYKMLTKQIMT